MQRSDGDKRTWLNAAKKALPDAPDADRLRRRMLWTVVIVAAVAALQTLLILVVDRCASP